MFSIIVASKRSFGYFKRAIESAIAQTYKDIEILVTDDASGVGEAKATFLSSQNIKFHIEINATSVGPTAARNQAIAKATKDWIAILDDDDEWHPEYLKVAAETLKGSRAWSFCLPSTEKLLQWYAIDREVPQFIHRLLYSGVGPGSGLIFSRKAIEGVGLFDPTFKVVSDRDLMLRLLLADYAPVQILGDFIIPGDGGITHDRKLWLEEAIALLEKFFTLPGSELYQAEKERAIEVWRRKLSPLSPS